MFNVNSLSPGKNFYKNKKTPIHSFAKKKKKKKKKTSVEVIDCRSELGDVEQRLQQGVHVASSLGSIVENLFFFYGFLWFCEVLS